MNARLEELIRRAQQLADQIGDQAARDEKNYLRGWEEAARVFFDLGVEVGRQQLSNELVKQDRRHTEYIRGIASSPTYSELERRRWEGRREKFGRPRPGDFYGVPPEIDLQFFCPRCQEAWAHCSCWNTR